MDEREEMEMLLYAMERTKLLREKIDNKDTMKLFLCKKCTDVVRCFKETRTCKCGESSGRYMDDGINAEFKGADCVPLGFANSKVVKAMQMAEIENKHQKEPTTCKGVDFQAFVLLDCSTTINTDKKPRKRNKMHEAPNVITTSGGIEPFTIKKKDKMGVKLYTGKGGEMECTGWFPNKEGKREQCRNVGTINIGAGIWHCEECDKKHLKKFPNRK